MKKIYIIILLFGIYISSFGQNDSLQTNKIYLKNPSTGIGIKIEDSNVSPNIGYLRFGDNTGWKFHIGRRKESTSVSQNSSTNGVLMTIQDNGNVGIGTINPSKNLTVKSNSSTLRLETAADPNSYYSELTSNYDAANRFLIKVGDTQILGNKDIGLGSPNYTVTYLNNYYGLGLSTGTNNPTSISTRLFVHQNGNVGIGTTTPLFRLDVNGVINVPENTSINVGGINGVSNSYFGYATSYRAIKIGGTGAISLGVDLTTNTNSQFQGNEIVIPNNKAIIAPNDANNNYVGILRYNSEKLFLGGSNYQTLGHLIINTTNGNVGIGTNNPTQKLETSGNIFINAENSGFVVDASGNSRIGLMKYYGFAGALVHGNTEPLLFGQVSQASVLGGTFSEQMRINNIGSVGINTSSPQAKLEVSGNPSGSSNFRATGNNARLVVDYNSLGQNYYDASLHLFRDFAGNEKMRINSSGQVAIGNPASVPTDYKLGVAGNIVAEKVKVKKRDSSGNWPDFVFSPTYKLPTLTEVENFVKQNQHLPEIPSASEIEKDGQDLGEMNRLLLKKVEELTLYLIEQNKKIESQQTEIEKLKKDIK